MRTIAVKIFATDKHCNNDCQFMSIDAKKCNLFDAALVWNKRRKYNGNERLKECQQIEIEPLKFRIKREE